MTKITVSIPASAARKIQENPEEFKAFANAHGFNIVSVQPHTPDEPTPEDLADCGIVRQPLQPYVPPVESAMPF